MNPFDSTNPDRFDPDMFDFNDGTESSSYSGRTPYSYNEPDSYPKESERGRDFMPDYEAEPRPESEERASKRRRQAPEPMRGRRPAKTSPAADPDDEPLAANGRQGISMASAEPVAKQRRRRGESAGSLRKFFTDQRTRIFLGVVLGLVTVYLLVVSISYFSNMVHDQSAVLSNTFASLTTMPEKVTNAGGPFGAWLSEMVISQWMGIGSFIMIFYVAALSVSLLGIRRVRFWQFSFKCFLLTVATSIVVGLATYELSSPFFWGGRHGYFFNEMLVKVSGIWGALCVSALMIAAVAIMFFKTLKRTWRRIRVTTLRRNHRRALQRRIEIERREAQEKIRIEAEARAKAEAQANENKDSDKGKVAFVEPEVAEAAVAEESPEPDPLKFEPEPELKEIPVAGFVDNEPKVPENLMRPDAIPTIGDMTIEAPQIEKADPETLEVNELEPIAEAKPGTDLYDPRLDLSRFEMPPTSLMLEREKKENNVDTEEQEDNKQRIIKTLRDYGIEISSIKATVGPTVTLYEIVPAEGVRISKIKNLENDIALSLSALGIRIIAPIPGKGTVGIEVPNKDPQTVSIRSVFESKVFQESKMELPMALGCTISNDVFMADLTKMPHLLVAGATGMGKSVGLNTIIASLLYKKHPAELKMVLVDPKMVEFSLYASLERHYLAKLPGDDDAIITDTSKVVATLNSLCKEMDDRYMLLKDANCRNIKEYNHKFTHRSLNPEKGHRFLPYIVVIVDEFADLIMTAGKEVETPIARIAQKARAVGIHMILATQRPSTNIITGVIKANFPGRIAFRVFQMVDSRTILDSPGANQLIGKGDMLFSNSGRQERVQCAFIDTPEVETLCGFIAGQQGYDEAYELPEFVPDDVDPASMGSINDRDPLFEDVARYVVMSGTTASTSSIQRRYSIGYNRAGRIMDQLEQAGIVGPATGGKPRQVLMESLQLERLLEIPM